VWSYISTIMVVWDVELRYQVLCMVHGRSVITSHKQGNLTKDGSKYRKIKVSKVIKMRIAIR
jgi:hypothetical protein